MEIVMYILVGLVAAMTLLSGILKVSKNKKIVDNLSGIGMAKLIPALGAAEILFAILFIYPPTRTLGFVLLACYFSGALATDLSHKNPFTAPLVILVLLFSAQYISSPGFFIN